MLHLWWLLSPIKQQIGKKHVVLFNILGLLDFAGAIGGGAVSGGTPIRVLSNEITSDIMQDLPLALIPTFAVPFWIVLHIISLIKLKRLEV